VIVDSSALVAVALREQPVADMLVRAVDEERDAIGIGAPTLVESIIVLEARLGARAPRLVHRLVDGLPIVVVSFTSAHARIAAEAWRRFGKGCHPAALNLGDCMSYATARIAERPLLCVGDDFARTDLAVVPLHP
jgi:ribonuclease VapC